MAHKKQAAVQETVVIQYPNGSESSTIRASTLYRGNIIVRQREAPFTPDEMSAWVMTIPSLPRQKVG
jgi:hypothetical protein